MSSSDYDSIYLCKLSPLEKRALNLTLELLLKEKEVIKTQIYETLSGLRENTNGNEKIKLATSKGLLMKWHKLGLITIFRDKIRLGNFLLYSNILDEKNQNEVIESLSFLFPQMPDKKA